MGGNKADSVNAGINVSEYPYIVSMDADEILQADALKHAIRPFFEDATTVAVGGLLGISNDVVFKHAYPVETKISKSLVAAMQSLEYSRAFMGSRIFSGAFNGNLNVSGGFGLFKKEALIRVNSYDVNSVAEDMDLALRLHRYYVENKIPYNNRYVANAICWTQAPFTLKDLAKQRSRWHRGLIQSMWQHRTIMLNPKYGLLGTVSYLFYFLYELMAPFIELLGIIIISLSFMLGILNVSSAIALALLYFLFCVFQTMVFYVGRYFIQDYQFFRWDTLKAFGITILDSIFYRPYLLFVRLYAAITYSTHLHSWHKIEREHSIRQAK